MARDAIGLHPILYLGVLVQNDHMDIGRRMPVERWEAMRMKDFCCRGLVIFAIGFALPMLTDQASAQQYEIGVAVSSRYDDNILRAQSAIKPTLPKQGEDIVTLVAANASMSSQLGLVDVNLRGLLSRSFFANHDLDATEYNTSAEARYSTGTASVLLTAENLRRQLPFEDVRASGSIIQNLTQSGLTVSKTILGSVRLVGEAGYTRNIVSGGLISLNAAERFRFGGGLGYFSPTGNSVTLEYEQVNGSGLRERTVLIGGQPVSFTSDIRRYSVLSKLNYAISPITKVNASFGYTKHNDRTPLNADFEGFVANASVTWKPAEHIDIRPSFRRSFSSQSELFSNGIRVTSYGVRSSVSFLPQLSGNVNVSQEHRLFRYDLQAIDPVSLGRRDKISIASAGISYVTGIKLVTSLDYQYSARSSTLPGFQFKSNMVMLTLGYAIRP